MSNFLFGSEEQLLRAEKACLAHEARVNDLVQSYPDRVMTALQNDEAVNYCGGQHSAAELLIEVATPRELESILTGIAKADTRALDAHLDALIARLTNDQINYINDNQE